MGLLDWFKYRGKWLYELQVYDNGWRTISDATPEKSKDNYVELFEPGKLYRLIRKNPDTLRYDKVVWRHWEPAPTPKMKLREPKERAQPRPARHITPAEYMREYAEQLYAMLEPIRIIGEIGKNIRDAFSGFGGGGGETLPPLEFEGRAPWFMHPYVAKTWEGVATRIIDHGAKRLGEVVEKLRQPITPTEEEIATEFPTLEEYTEEEVPPEAVTARTEIEVKPSEVEEEEKNVQEASEGAEEEA